MRLLCQCDVHNVLSIFLWIVYNFIIILPPHTHTPHTHTPHTLTLHTHTYLTRTHTHTPSHTHTPHTHTPPPTHTPHTPHTPTTHTPHTIGMDESTIDLATRTPEQMSSLSKNATALRGRRGAVNRKQAETKDIKGHMFIKKFFRRPTYCSLCREFLW